MSQTYPLGRSALDALAKATLAARTRYEADALAGESAIIEALETEWVTPAAADLDALMKQADANPAHGFIQHYEDASHNTVLAITYWKLVAAKKPKAKPAKPPKPPQDAPATDLDHTDDLYFKAGRTRPKRRARPADPNQMDLFGAPNKS